MYEDMAFWRVVFAFLIFTCLASAFEPIVHTVEGTIRGTTLIASRTNQSYFAFMGIPFAKPPVGDLRFKPAQPVTPWSGILNTTTEGANCMQFRSLPISKSSMGNEDCLFLNVYTPELPSGTEKKLMAVMVWIHGGEFVQGSGDRNVFGPDYLIIENIVLVTMNYRLGLLGFLSLQNEAVPGNNGLKDQIVAMKWVKRNIDKFGGDPNKVTIFGESAGAACIHYHLLSPMTKGLFNFAISESGSTLSPWAYQTPESNLKLAFDIAETYGPRTNNRSEVLRRLMSADARDFDEYIKEHIIRPRVGPIIGPTLDTNAQPGNVFLPDLPINMINSGNYHKIPYIIGMNNEEGILVARLIKKLALILRPVRLIFQFGLPFYVGEHIINAKEMAIEVKEKYFINTRPFVLKYIDVITDMFFGNSVYCTAKKHALKSTVYSYEFSFNGTANVVKKLCDGGEFPGAAHGDDIAYLFNLTALSATIKPGTPEYTTSRRMVRLWTNFAKTGNPTPSPDPVLQNLTWPRVTSSSFQYMSIDTDLSIKENLNDGHGLWWEQLYDNFTVHASPCWTAH